MAFLIGNSDDGSKLVDEFLDRGYSRTTAVKVCKDGEIDVSKVTVWVNDEARWRQLSANEIMELTQNTDRSLCKAIASNLFHLNDIDYQTIKHTFEHSTVGLEGIYEKGHKNDKQYALVVRLPVDLAEQGRKIAKYVSLPTLAVTSAGTLTYKVTDRIHPRSISWRKSHADFKFYEDNFWNGIVDFKAKQTIGDRKKLSAPGKKLFVELILKYMKYLSIFPSFWPFFIDWISKNYNMLVYYNLERVIEVLKTQKPDADIFIRALERYYAEDEDAKTENASIGVAYQAYLLARST
jgi:hypothetical protein